MNDNVALSFVLETVQKRPLWLVFHRRTTPFRRQIDENSRSLRGPDRARLSDVT